MHKLKKLKKSSNTNYFNTYGSKFDSSFFSNCFKLRTMYENLTWYLCAWCHFICLIPNLTTWPCCYDHIKTWPCMRNWVHQEVWWRITIKDHLRVGTLISTSSSWNGDLQASFLNFYGAHLMRKEHFSIV